MCVVTFSTITHYVDHLATVSHSLDLLHIRHQLLLHTHQLQEEEVEEEGEVVVELDMLLRLHLNLNNLPKINISSLKVREAVLVHLARPHLYATRALVSIRTCMDMMMMKESTWLISLQQMQFHQWALQQTLKEEQKE
jgi:hypothetical protein